MLPAITYGHTKAIKMLLKDGAVINDDHIKQAVITGRLRVIKLLIPYVEDMTLFLKEACSNGKLEIVKYLVDIGVSQRDRNFTALFYSRDHPEVSEYLISIGADCNEKLRFLWTFFTHCSDLSRFIHLCTDINQKDRQGNSLYYHHCNNVENIKVLLLNNCKLADVRHIAHQFKDGDFTLWCVDNIDVPMVKELLSVVCVHFSDDRWYQYVYYYRPHVTLPGFERAKKKFQRADEICLKISYLKYQHAYFGINFDYAFDQRNVTQAIEKWDHDCWFADLEHVTYFQIC